LGNMTYLMFLILCFLIIACGQRKPETKTLHFADKDYDPDWIKNYGKTPKEEARKLDQ
jgi:hypothetical protein